jgi:hypothetical protein
VIADASMIERRAATIVKRSTSSLARSLLTSLTVATPAARARFVLNTSNRLVRALPDTGDRERVRRVVRVLYVQCWSRTALRPGWRGGWTSRGSATRRSGSRRASIADSQPLATCKRRAPR